MTGPPVTDWTGTHALLAHACVQPRPRPARQHLLAPLLRTLAATAALALVGGADCATVPRHGPSAPFEARGNPPDATVWIDDRMMGTVLELTRAPRRIAAGFHRIEIRCPGFESHFEELDVKPELPQVVRFELHEILQ
jgi:hypothetical protein